MKNFVSRFRLLISPFVFLLSSFSIAAPLSEPIGEKLTPQLYFESGELLDLMYEMQSGKEIPLNWKSELKARTTEFQSGWDQNARELIQESEVNCGRRFVRKEYSVALVLGPYLPMARPFLMNMLPYLRTFNAPNEAATMNAFVALTHHELLHHLLDNTEGEDFRKFSKLIQKYQNKDNPSSIDLSFVPSDDNVLAHIHLMALQKAVYEKLGRSDLVAEADNTYLKVIGGAYAKAWKIVLQEGTRPFLVELQQFNMGL